MVLEFYEQCYFILILKILYCFDCNADLYINIVCLNFCGRNI